MTAVLRAEGLSKRFGGLKANDNVTLSLEKGQILGLIGPNGAGKSTCFAMLAGSIPPTSGRVFLGDQEITGKPAFRVARAGVVRTHQIVRPFANLTVIENCTVAAAQCSGRDDAGSRELAREMLRFVGLEKRRNDYPAGLTLAHRKKLEMARALSCAPKALLLDEVIAGVNPVEAREMVALIRRIRDEKGISILMIEHVMAAVMSVCEHVVVLDAGKLIAAGAPKEVVQNAAVIEAYLGKKHA
ncbi:MAG: ABC transporter ATP-binding protein [Deltaproteobacteria bacterium]|jgi:branched-chain amino acid transport system ATP-binding protein|nr:MAG: ABC transporter ATP-binding protein [Deltaproteobacteria bacterium]